MVDFAAMRDAVKRLGGDPQKINPCCPADLVIDHSVQVDVARRSVQTNPFINHHAISSSPMLCQEIRYRIPNHSGKRENLENEFPFFKSGKLGRTPKFRGTLREFDIDPEGKGCCQFGVCASCALCPKLCFAATSNLINVKIFLMEISHGNNSGNFVFIKCWEP